MPIDASIYSQLKPLPPPEIPDPLAQAGKVMQIRNAQQTEAINAERLRQEQAQTAAAEREQADAQVVQQHLQQFGGDFDKALPALAGKINPTSYQKLETHVADIRNRRQQMAKADREALDWKVDRVTDARLAVLNAPPEQKEAEHQRQGQRLKALGIDTAEWEPQYPGDDAVKSEIGFAKWFKSSTDQAEEARKQATAQQSAAAAQREAELQPFKVQKATADAQLAGMEVAGQKPIQPAERLRLDREEAAAKEQTRHNKAMEARFAQANAAGLSQAQSQRVMQIANQFDNEPMVRNYNTIAEAENFVRTLGEQKQGNAGDDQALLYAFAKAMDPQSVVREGEYATVQKYSQSWADTFGFKANRVFSNSPFLSDEARKMMKETITKKASSAKQSYDNIYNEYGRRIERQAGIQGGKDFLTNYGQAFNSPASGGGAPRINTKEEYDKLPSGAQYVDAADGKTYTKR